MGQFVKSEILRCASTRVSHAIRMPARPATCSRKIYHKRGGGERKKSEEKGRANPDITASIMCTVLERGFIHATHPSRLQLPISCTIPVCTSTVESPMPTELFRASPDLLAGPRCGTACTVVYPGLCGIGGAGHLE